MQYCWIDFAFLDNNFASFYLFFIFHCKTRDPLRKKSSVIEPGEFARILSWVRRSARICSISHSSKYTWNISCLNPDSLFFLIETKYASREPGFHKAVFVADAYICFVFIFLPQFFRDPNAFSKYSQSYGSIRLEHEGHNARASVVFVFKYVQNISKI